jgi:tetratricopeptide (TPR) repeat protein
MGPKNIIYSICFWTILTSCQKREIAELRYRPEAVELNNKAVEILMVYPDSALDLLDKAIELDTSYYLPHSNKIQIYRSQKEYENAIKEANEIIQIRPEMGESYVMLGMLYDKTDQTDKSEAQYSKAIEIFEERIAEGDKNESSNRLSLAIALILSGQDYEGQEELKKLVSDYPDEKLYSVYVGMTKEKLLNEILDK